MQELMEMGEYEEAGKMGGMGDGSSPEKEYADKGHAGEHAKEFLARAKEVLHYNKKEGDGSEVAKLAHQYAKDYYSAICDEIEKTKYAGGDGAETGM